MTWLARIPERAGYTTDGRFLFLTRRVSLQKSVKKIHQVHYYQEMLRGLGLTPGPDELFLQLPDDACRRAAEQLANAGADADTLLIGFNPGASYGPAKRWPAAKFGALAERLVMEYGGSGCRILVFGTDADRETAEAIRNFSGRTARHVVSLAGRTTLAEAMALIARCRVFVSNDSGLMHVGAALQTSTVAIFGSTNPVTTGPYSKNSVVIRKEMPCSPCLKTHCRSADFKCMQDITGDEVFAAASGIIQRTSSRKMASQKVRSTAL